MATAISSPVSVDWYPIHAFFLIALGLAVSAYFFIGAGYITFYVTGVLIFGYEATSTRKTRKLSTELLCALASSVFLGFGTLFLLLSAGVYV